MLEVMVLWLMSQQQLDRPQHPLVGQVVTCSWYGQDFQGLTMANGQPFDMNNQSIVAHKKLPFGTKVTLQNPTNGRILEAVVCDRGPHVAGREFDLSQAGAQHLGVINQGIPELQVLSVKKPQRE